MSVKQLMKQKQAAAERQRKEIERQAQRLAEMREAQRKKDADLNARIREERKVADEKQALVMGKQLIRILRQNAPGFFGEFGQFRSRLLVGALIDAHAKMKKEGVASKWIETGESFFKKNEQTKSPSEENEKPTKEDTVDESDGLPDVESIFSSGEQK